MNPVHTIPSYSFKIHFNIILPSMSRSSNWFIFFRFLDQNAVRIFLLPHQSHLPFLIVIISMQCVIQSKTCFKLNQLPLSKILTSMK
jgi:hypothetical protein